MLERFLVPEADRVHVAEADVRAATQAIFEKMGLPPEDAALATDVLITSDLRGCESHGASNMLRNYVRMYGTGFLKPEPDVRVLRESPVSASLDADSGLGIQVGPKAMQLAIDKAATSGIGAVTVANGGHFGMLAYYALMALPHDMIGVAMVAAGGHLQVPLWGTEPLFGTHPIAWSAPSVEHPPFVFDVATTQVAANKLMLTRRIGSQLEPGWITGLDGEPILEAVDSPDYGGFLMLPFGGTRENGGHKGYGFATIVDIMAGILASNRPGHLAEPGKHSLFVMAIQIEAFMDASEFKADMDQLLGRIAAMAPIARQERVYYAGLLEHEETKRRKTSGIPYHREVVDWYNETAVELGLDYHLP
ncbi:MAG: Ldh family oxidoreductase [Pseudomonadota bacterium]